MSDEKWVDIKKLPVAFKRPVDTERSLTPVHFTGCSHGLYEVDLKAAEVSCRKCGLKMNPMSVLWDLAVEESHYAQARVAYQQEMARLAERSKTKCQHCGKLTRISRS